jgi:excisionase family DNA binding protein
MSTGQADQKTRAILNIVRLRRAEHLGDPGLRSELASVREFLEDLAGPTISPADAARLLGVSQPALKRWLDKGEISSVRTPQGRREIPLSEVIELLEQVEQLRGEGASRPLAAAIRERHRRASETIDLERLLPRRRPRTHRVPEVQSLAYHRAVADRLDENVVDEAKRRLHRWRDDNRIHPRWAEEWERVLAMPLPRIAKAISADSKHAAELRQSSPFAGVLTEQERQRLVRAVEERMS